MPGACNLHASAHSRQVLLKSAKTTASILPKPIVFSVTLSPCLCMTKLCEFKQCTGCIQALCRGWTGCSTPWLCCLHLILSVMISAKVTSAKKVCMTMTSAGQVGTADHTNVECDCKTCVQYWTCAKSAWQLYLQVDVLLWECAHSSLSFIKALKSPRHCSEDHGNIVCSECTDVTIARHGMSSILWRHILDTHCSSSAHTAGELHVQHTCTCT